MRFRPANIRVINRRQNLPRLLLALSLKDDENKDTAPIDVQTLTGHSISILRGPLHVVDHQRLHLSLALLQLQPEATQH